MRVDVSAEAGEFVRGRGGRLWVWAAHPRVCCRGTPAYMHAATVPPAELPRRTRTDWRYGSALPPVGPRAPSSP